jgi:ubiquinone/menaquinone biosynthesis C-methylase UbiE
MNIDYTELSKTYDKNRWYPKRLIEEIIEFGSFKDGMKILDIGCGTGNVAFQLSELINGCIIGVDISISMLTMAKERALTVVCTDVDNNPFPFPNNSFDTVVGAYVIHQLNNTRFLLSECYRILRDGLLVLLTFSHEQIEHQHPLIKQFFPSYIDIDRKRFPDIPRIDDQLKSVGFSDIKHQEVLVKDFAIDQEYLDRVKNKYVSTCHLMPQREYDLGVKRLESCIKNTSKNPEWREWSGTLIRGRN